SRRARRTRSGSAGSSSPTARAGRSASTAPRIRSSSGRPSATAASVCGMPTSSRCTNVYASGRPSSSSRSQRSPSRHRCATLQALDGTGSVPPRMDDRPRPEHPPLDAGLRREIIERFNEINRDRFGGHLGYRLADVRRGWARIEVDSTPQLMNPSGVMHGGASFGLADSAVAAALLTIYGPGFALLTIEMKINYLEPIV